MKDNIRPLHKQPKPKVEYRVRIVKDNGEPAASQFTEEQKSDCRDLFRVLTKQFFEGSGPLSLTIERIE